MPLKKLNIGVLMGGKSIEREVSLNSGRTVCDYIDSARYNVIPIFQTIQGTLYLLPLRFLHRGKISDFEHRLEAESKQIAFEDLKQLVDIIYIAFHGRYGEDGCLQGFLEILGIPYVGSKVMASALGMDKSMQRIMLAANNIAVPKSITLLPHELHLLFSETANTATVLENFDLPVVVKPNNEGSSLGISVVHTLDDVVPSLQRAATCHPGKIQSVIIEEYLNGMEFSCIVITDYQTGNPLPLPPTEIVPEAKHSFFDYEQKYMPGRATKYTPARCSPQEQNRIGATCVQVMKTLGISNLARIDGFLMQDGRIVITDPNTFAGMSPSSFAFVQAAQRDMSHTQLINHLIETELYSHGILSLPTQHQSEIPMAQKLRVAVLFGGRSNEKEISLESGRNIIYKLSPHLYEAIPLFVDSNLNLHRINQQLLVFNSTKEIQDALEPSMQVSWTNLPRLADFAFIGLHGGEGENGCVQGTLEMLGIPYNGSGVLTSALCMDKYKTTQFLRHVGFDVPLALLLSKHDWLHNIPYQLPAPFPLIIKPHDDGCSILVQKADNHAELEQALDKIFAQDKTHALIEEYITGMELTVGVIGNEEPHALPPSQAVATKGILSIEEKFLPGAGENQTPAPLSYDKLAFVQKTMENAYRTLGCKGYARIDCFFQSADQSPTGRERVIILEINTLPGMTPATCIFHQAAEVGIHPMTFIEKIITLGLQEHQRIDPADIEIKQSRPS